MPRRPKRLVSVCPDLYHLLDSQPALHRAPDHGHPCATLTLASPPVGYRYRLDAAKS